MIKHIWNPNYSKLEKHSDMSEKCFVLSNITSSRRTKVKVRTFLANNFLLFFFPLPISFVARSLIFSPFNARRKLALIALGRGILPTSYAQDNSAPTRLPERPERSSRKRAYVDPRPGSFFGRHDRLTLYRHASRITWRSFKPQT